ncbi:sigma-70 family RNA polymerase sigma factor [Citricoccus sp. GCM10030269]|uniref:sigma-70 family RNA polymerase sigma factor n=1 Tax=Citricoccus sp. GCM10030269 TaxID=3273388 RepID=UPI00361517EB
MSQARNDLVEQNIPLVGYAVSEMHHRYPMVERDEMVSVGLEGLVLAARDWDPDAGTQFSTWAHLKIRWAIQEFLQHLDWMGRRGRDKAKRLERARAQLTHSLGRDPENSELAAALGVSVEDLQAMTAEASKSMVPMDDSISDMLAATEDGPEKRVLDAEKDLLLHKAVDSLPERTRQVVQLHYFQGMAQGEVAQQLGVSDATVSKEKKRGLALLQEVLGTALSVRPAESLAASVPAAGRERFLAAAGGAMQGGIVPPVQRYA